MNKLQKFLLLVLIVETLLLPFAVHHHNQVHNTDNQSVEVKIIKLFGGNIYGF